jgi:Zn-dependent protease/CBS domain-containing protein
MQETEIPSQPRNRNHRRMPGGYPGIRLFKVMGIPVYARPSLFLIMAAMAYIFGWDFFPQKYASLQYKELVYGLMGVAAAILFFFSVFVHEVAHCILARTKIGGQIPIRRITLFFLGGLSEMTEEPHTATGELVISFAGPLTSIVMGGIMMPGASLLHSAGAPVFVTGVIHYIGFLNIFLGLSNLLPGFPFDGGRVLRALIWSASGNFLAATRISTAMGRICGVGIAVLGGVTMFWSLFQGFFLIMIGLFVEQNAREAMKFALLKAALEGMRVADVIYPGLPNLWQGATLAEGADYLLRHRTDALPVVDDAGHLRGVFTSAALNEVPREAWPRVAVKEIFDEDVVPAFVRMDEPLNDVLMLMLRHALTALPVLDNEARVAGVITLRDLNRAAGYRMRIGH